MDIHVAVDNTGFSAEELEETRKKAAPALEQLFSRDSNLPGKGWVTYPNTITEEEIKAIEKAAKTIRDNSEVLIVVGVGGSSIGSRAVINLFPGDGRTEVLYLGDNLSGGSFHRLLSKIEEKSFSVCAISKSGNTLETLISFDLIRKVLVERYGEKQANQRTYIVTENKDSALKAFGETGGVTNLFIPGDIGGRYSVFTAVTLLPMAVHGLSIRDFLAGAQKIACKEAFEESGLDYAVCRNLFFSKGFAVEAFEFFDADSGSLGGWIQQLFGESEGKEKKGLFPTTLFLNRAVHSMEQFIQDGNRCFFETMVLSPGKHNQYYIPEHESVSGLGGKSLDEILNAIKGGVEKAHRNGEIPFLVIGIDVLSESNMGELMYFFMVQCAVSALLLGVNPFDQPGVEQYKRYVRKSLFDEE